MEDKSLAINLESNRPSLVSLNELDDKEWFIDLIGVHDVERSNRCSVNQIARQEKNNFNKHLH